MTHRKSSCAAPRPFLLLPVLFANRYQIHNAPSPSGIYDINPTSEKARSRREIEPRYFTNQFNGGGVNGPRHPSAAVKLGGEEGYS